MSSIGADERLDDESMLTHGLHSVLFRLAAESAVHGNAEVVQVPGRGRAPATEPLFAVDRQDDPEGCNPRTDREVSVNGIPAYLSRPFIYSTMYAYIPAPAARRGSKRCFPSIRIT